MLLRFSWSELLDSNQRPLEPHSSAIPNFAKPGNISASLDCSDILAYCFKKIKYYFYFFQIYFLPADINLQQQIISVALQSIFPSVHQQTPPVFGNRKHFKIKMKKIFKKSCWFCHTARSASSLAFWHMMWYYFHKQLSISQFNYI